MKRDRCRDVLADSLLRLCQRCERNHPGDGDWSPRLMAGARAAPPEDCMGPPGYEMMLQSRTADRKAGELWATMPEGFDPERFDPWALDHALSLAAAWGAI